MRTDPPTVVLWSDRPDVFGAEQINHEVALGLYEAGIGVKFVQARADHHLIEAREKRGISHHWIEFDDIYDLDDNVPSQLTDHSGAAEVIDALSPSLVLFSDSCPHANLAAKEVASQRGIPWITTNHCINPDWWRQYSQWTPRLASVLPQAAAMVAVSTANLESVRSNCDLAPEFGSVILNGRPEEFFAATDPDERARLRQEWGIEEGQVVFATVARLEQSKGLQYWLKALVELQQWEQRSSLRFVLVGEGSMRFAIERMVSVLQWRDQVQLLGLRRDIPAILGASDAFILPSQYEGMPLGVLEAMAKSLPVIATAVAGTPEALGGTGLLLPDPASEPIEKPLAEAIKELVNDSELREQLGAAAGQRARNQFRLSRMARDYVQLVQSELPV